MASELEALTALARALSRPAELADSLDAALTTVADQLGLETGWIWLIDEADDDPVLAASRALPPALREHPDAMRGDCYCLRTFRAGDLRGAANVNVVWCSRLERLIEDDEGATHLRCHASVPLSVGERRLGMINVASRDWRVLSQPELNLLTTAGALVSLVVERARLETSNARAHAVEERNRMAREIHDTLAQSLAALTLQLEVADSLAGRAQDQRVNAAVARALTMARTTLDDARRSVLELRDSPLEGRSLVEALQNLAGQHGGTTVRIEGIDDTMALSRAIELGLFRIAQQALANVAQHAAARHAVLQLQREGDLIRLRIEDDGVGFEPAQVHAGRFGLLGMRERAHLLGGQLTVESGPGQGTAIEAVVPLHSENESV